MASQTTAARPTLNPALRPFWLAPARNRVLYGGRASTKSWDAAGFATFLTSNYKLRVLCVRQFQNKIEESVYTLLKAQISRFGLTSQFRILDNKIIGRETESEFLFYGLWRSIDEIKSLEGIDILWIEEAHNLTEEQWKILEPTIRKAGSQIWIIFNPRLATDFVYRRFVLNPPPNTIVRKINYDENQFLSDTMLAVINAAKEEDEEEFAHIYLGVPKDDDEGAVIKRSWLLAAIDAHKALGFGPAGTRRLGFDVADGGADKCANVFAHGSVVSWADEWKAGEDELLQSCSRTYAVARERSASIRYDSIGVGASAGAKFAELNEARRADSDNASVFYEKFNAGAAVWEPDEIYQQPNITNKDQFANIKAQAWWMVADRFRNTYNAVKRGMQFTEDQLISLDSACPHLDKLIDELATPRRQFDDNGRVKVESKKDLAKPNRPGGPRPSPNIADALIMCYAPGEHSIETWAKLAQ
ncbi:PBSX family phage terminase large subunit [Cupriavidus pinatubonensis]|uniref:PBSX family phage terminase large subunit n=1 Tax=Cupriavidus pinatubonensis TaxID=248026 RepID=UPI001C739D40|nr:PBSX family phage terminase large subunit [Cupriavidus pinatubonensis]QYY30249.1 PBSX family phage terminase large subunit [Cupriavidus pinatubonensis]